MSTQRTVDLIRLFPGINLQGIDGPAIAAALQSFIGTPVATPTTDGLQSHYDRGSVINFVTDCGADPTGATDCSAALNAAWTLIGTLAADPKLPKQSTTLFVPRGRYFVGTGAKTFWSFTQGLMPMTVHVVGAGTDSTIFELGCGSGGQPFTLLNGKLVRFSDLSFVGSQAVPGIDCQCIIDSQGTEVVELERVNVVWTTASLAQFYFGAGLLVMRDMIIASNGTTDQTKATVYMYQAGGLFEDNVHHLDPFSTSGLNGYTFAAEKDYNTPCHVRLEDSGGPTGTQGDFLHFRNCLWDEGTAAMMIINGGPTANRRHVVFEDCAYNPPIGTAGGGGTAALYGFHISNTDLLTIRGLRCLGFNDTNVPMMDLVAVGTAHVSGLRPAVGAAFHKTINVDSACGYLEIEDSTIADTDLHSSATYGMRKELGRAYDLYAANGTIAANQLCKLGASGAVAIGTGDTIDVVVGAARQAAAAAGKVSLSRPGQVVPMLSDGSATIAIGDNVGISGTSAGRVKTVAASAVDRVGKAVTAATNVADTVVYVQFSPFKS